MLKESKMELHEVFKDKLFWWLVLGVFGGTIIGFLIEGLSTIKSWILVVLRSIVWLILVFVIVFLLRNSKHGKILERQKKMEMKLIKKIKRKKK